MADILKMLVKSRFEIVTTTAGAVSIRNNEVNEIMHNPVGPWVEANSLYIDQSGLKNLLSKTDEEELVLFDVGLGAAANALAALACAQSISHSRPFRIISFERDLELLHFACEHAYRFEHFKGYENALQLILNQGNWSDGNISWELRQGNFLEKIETEIYKPHLIFFDPYSPKVNNEMWTLECFKKIRAISRAESEGGTSFYTYSQATHIRVALMRAGFFVGYGSSTGLKAETTQAATQFQQLKSPLAKIWFDRWEKSTLRYPYDCLESEQKKLDDFIRSQRTAYDLSPV